MSRLITPKKDVIEEYNKFWVDPNTAENASVQLFTDCEKICVSELIPIEEFIRYKDNDEAIIKLVNERKFEEALIKINSTYHTRLSTENFNVLADWLNSQNDLNKMDIDAFIGICKNVTGKNAYSFASKVFSFIAVANGLDRYPIIDSISATLLAMYLECKQAEFGNYGDYCKKYNEFKEKNELNDLSYKQIDIFLWTYGTAILRYWENELGVFSFSSVEYKGKGKGDKA